MKKLCFIILDGAAGSTDTALEKAKTPNLDKLAETGLTGLVKPIPGIAPQSNAAIFSLLGYSTEKIPSRGPVEALGAGIDLEKPYIAFRTNFATLEGELWSGKLLDRRAGRTLTTKEAKKLEKAINEIDIGHDFIFKSTIEHRGVLVIKGNWKKATNTDAAYEQKGNIGVVGSGGIKKSKGDEKTAQIINKFVEKSHETLENHPVNQKRLEKDLLPANILLTRDSGTSLPSLETMENKTGLKWTAVIGMPLEKGIAKLTGMQIRGFNYPPITETNTYENLEKDLECEIENSKKAFSNNSDAFYFHFKEFDIPGHDGNLQEKIKLLELVDKKFFSWLLKQNTFAVITCDHATPWQLKNHSKDPVPLVIWGNGRDYANKFTEKDCSNGSLANLRGNELMKKIIKVTEEWKPKN